MTTVKRVAIPLNLVSIMLSHEHLSHPKTRSHYFIVFSKAGQMFIQNCGSIREQERKDIHLPVPKNGFVGYVKNLE